MKKIIVGSIALLAPTFVFAQPGNIGTPDVGGVYVFIQGLMNAATVLLLAAAAVDFMWGVFQFMRAEGEEPRAEGRTKIIYGLIGIALMASLWGIVKIITTTAGNPDQGGAVNPPSLPF